jgi:hypothetical protein
LCTHKGSNSIEDAVCVEIYSDRNFNERNLKQCLKVLPLDLSSVLKTAIDGLESGNMPWNE